MQTVLQMSDTSLAEPVHCRFESCPLDFRGVAQLVEEKCERPVSILICLHHMGVNWFRQVVNGTENTGMIPPYGSNKRTDEDNIYGELKAA